MSPGIRPVGIADRDRLAAHFARHWAESGRGEPPFMPFAPGGAGQPRPVDGQPLALPLSEPGWQRIFAAVTDAGDIVGHVDLTGDRLHTGLHRCRLGIGIERAHRGQGLGRRLMQTAIAFAEAADSIAWLDLRVFAHNRNARSLYLALGFDEIGTVIDRFRIDGLSVDDVIMTLDVQSGPSG